MYSLDMILFSLLTHIVTIRNRNEEPNTAITKSVWLYLFILLTVAGLSHAEVKRDPLTETVDDETAFFNSQMYKLLQNRKKTLLLFNCGMACGFL